jgi:Tfp pilus assembly protein PilX
MTPTSSVARERGIALVLVMLITVAVAALAAGAIFLTGSSYLISRGQQQEEDMRNAADAGIELGRSALNGNPALFPDTGYVALQSNQPVYDASGNAIPGVTRSVYVGPTGSSTGQYGIFGSVVSVIQNQSGAVVVRRGELAQESFAKYAYYTNSEGSGICFGGGDQIFGPLHTNDNMCIYNSGARFHSTVEVAGSITGANYGTFDMGYIAHGAVIPLPTVTALAKLATYATQGGMNFTAPSGGTATQSRLRIEFVPLDINGDGKLTDPNDGFFKVYIATSSTNAKYVTGTQYGSYQSAASSNNQDPNCGDFHVVVTGGIYDTTFYSAYYHYNKQPNNTAPPPGTIINGSTGGTEGSTASTNATNSLRRGAWSKCYLLGDDHLNFDTVGTRHPNTFRASDYWGAWQRYTTTPDPAVIAALKNPASRALDTTLATRTLEAQYLWPLSRQYNPNSKGVIYVNGNAVVSGTVRGHVTLAASGNVIVADDIKYSIPPGSAPCLAADMLGLIASGYIYMSDNVMNTPQPWSSSGGYEHLSATTDEYLQGVLLTLNSFTVEGYDTGPTSSENCGTDVAGRGCLYITGGIIQGTRGAVGQTNGTGYVKRYAYDNCAMETPPPYFPTTGRFFKNRYYEIDPVGFNVASFFASLTPTP